MIQTPIDRYAPLLAKMAEHNRRPSERDVPTVTDAECDLLTRELRPPQMWAPLHQQGLHACVLDAR